MAVSNISGVDIAVRMYIHVTNVMDNNKLEQIPSCVVTPEKVADYRAHCVSRTLTVHESFAVCCHSYFSQQIHCGQ